MNLQLTWSSLNYSDIEQGSLSQIVKFYRVDLFWEKNSKKVSFGLVTGSSQSIGNVIEYDSMPSNGNEDNSYDCSIAFHDEHVSTFRP